MKLNWKDESSWSRSDIDRTPKTWSSEVGQFRAVVTRRHGLSGWYVEFANLFNYKPLMAAEIEEAKREACFLIYGLLGDAKKAFIPDGRSDD